jgi:exopolysaccharide biosynthesis WecB/TagA/CpsF family protein
VKLLEFDGALQEIMDRATSVGSSPLGVCSANLDHILHFGAGSRWMGTMAEHTSVEWLTLLDGAPLVAQARRLTDQPWPRLAGSDLVEPLLDEAERRGLSVGFLGGTEQAQELIRSRFAVERPDLAVAGWWAPERSVISDEQASLELAAQIAATAPDILVVGMGKPRQELWVSKYGRLTGAKILLAFGAVVDFLAGRIRRAPSWISSHGFEWAWRLMLEPRRLARRYLVDGPEAYLKLRQVSAADVPPTALPMNQRPEDPIVAPAEAGKQAPRPFLLAGAKADIAVIVVTYNNADDVGPLISSLRAETVDQTMKVVVADNSPDELTMTELAHHPDVMALRTGGNLGYAGGINAALRVAGPADAYLILNPDLRVGPGAVAALRRRMSLSHAGVVVPVLLENDGKVYPSLRREPSVMRALGDAALGSHLRRRPSWLSEMDFDVEGYQYAHRIEWATGAALLISEDAARAVGEWDEQFFLYSEETDYCHRIRQAGKSIWFEPTARMWHEGGGSGTSPQLTALMSVNRVRYASKHLGRSKAVLFRAAVFAAELARINKPGHREAARALLRKRLWPTLPHATRSPALPQVFPAGAVIIPAHNEAKVIGRTLESLKEVINAGTVDVIVACNGCTDDTETVASHYRGVKVLHVGEASKTAALNAADGATELWPRLYLDADVEPTPEAVRAVFKALEGGTLLAARPAFSYETTGAPALVRAYYRARNRIPGNAQGMWGAGAYALNAKGHERLGEFPALTGDDYYVDGLFQAGEKRVLATDPVVVRTPRSSRALLAILRRNYRGNRQQRASQDRGSGASGSASSTRQTLRELAVSIRGPVSAFDAFVYAVFAVVGRYGAVFPGGKSDGWERDESSRQ